jgi:hypothetical protein
MWTQKSLSPWRERVGVRGNRIKIIEFFYPHQPPVKGEETKTDCMLIKFLGIASK